MKKIYFNNIKKTFILFFFIITILGCNNDDDKYSNIQKQESGIIDKINRWLEINNISIEEEIISDTTQLLQQYSSDSYVVFLPVKSENNQILEKLLININGDLIKARLWSFHFEKPQNISVLNQFTIHEILKYFSGSLLVRDFGSNGLQKTSYEKGTLKFQAQLSGGIDSFCSRCHNGILDEVLIVVQKPGPMLPSPIFPEPILPYPVYNNPPVIINPSNPKAKEDYPDCNSFNFIKTTGLWMEAAVRNINFDVIVVQSLAPLRYRKIHISLPQAVSFQMPTNLEVGNTNITPGMAAQSAANALAIAMQQTKNYYKTILGTEMMVYRYFTEALKNEFELGNPGARLQLNPMSTVAPTNYKKNWFGPGDCK